MKKSLLSVLIIVSSFAFAQIPQSFKYQSVVRDGNGVLAVNKIISVKTSILTGSTLGSNVYSETQTLSTNDYGVVSLNIGAGTLVSGNFATINWGATTYFVKTELDINGGTNYIFMGTSQILSVPYALYAEKSGNALADHDTSATNEIQTLSVTGNNLNISNGNTIALPPDADNNPTNELQNLSVTGHAITISNGNSVSFPPDTLTVSGYTLGIANGNIVNLPPPQHVSILGDSLHITNGNAVYLSGSVDLDASPTNELQNLSLNNGTLSISIGNNIHLPDSSTTNEIQNLSLNGGTLNISQANSVLLPDSSAVNELQTLSISQGSLSISGKNTIHLPDSSSTNELQNLSVVNDTLVSISQGNSVHINTSRSLKFPQGVDGTPVSILANNSTTYTVPTGKNLYITSLKSTVYQYGGIKGAPVYSSGTVIALNTGDFLMGILINQSVGIQIVNSIIVDGGATYLVPSGKTLYLKSTETSGFIKANNGGSDIVIGNNSWELEPFIFQSGVVISLYGGGTPQGYITGYLK